MSVLTGPDGCGGCRLRVFGGRGADEGVVDGADGDAVLVHLSSQAVEEGLHGVFGGGIWKKGQRSFFFMPWKNMELTRLNYKCRWQHSKRIF